MKGHEGTGMKPLVLNGSLGKDGPYSDVGSVNLNHKLTSRVWMDEDGGSRESLL
jgi:hypothetical protein